VNLLFGRVFKALGTKPRYKPIIPSRAIIPALKIFSDTMILMIDLKFYLTHKQMSTWDFMFEKSLKILQISTTEANL
jgi:hypothetical protein